MSATPSNSAPPDVATPRVSLPESRVVAYVVIALMVAVVCAYARVFRADFIQFDDNSHVFENPLVKGGLSWRGAIEAFAHPHASLWVPLTWLSFMTDVSLFGMNPGAMHAVNLAWHTASTALLFLTLRRMTRHLWASAFVAALFGLHPLNVESVAWIAERKNVLSAFFWFASIAAYARYAEKPRPLPYLAALAGAALALVAKPMAVTLPCTLLLLDFWPLARWRAVGWRRLLLEKVPFFLLSAGASWMAVHARRAEAVVTAETLPLTERISNALVSYLTYLGKLMWPVDLGVFYPYPEHPQTVLAVIAALLLLVVTALGIREWKRQPWLLMGWLWFLGILVPVIGLVQVGSQARADRFTYVPQLGIFLAVTWLVKECWRWQACALRWGAGLALAACALLSAHQVTYWLDGATLFEHTAAVTQENAWAYALAGIHRARQGDVPVALAEFQASLRIKPDQSAIWREFGQAWSRIGKAPTAVEAFRMALKYDPSDLHASYELAVTLEKIGQTDEAIARLGQLAQDLPKSAGVHYHLARALESKGRHEEALPHLREAARLAPGQPEIAMALKQVDGGMTGVRAYPEF
jgi:tetratricopeptide (TPR) repeat protein